MESKAEDDGQDEPRHDMERDGSRAAAGQGPASRWGYRVALAARKIPVAP